MTTSTTAPVSCEATYRVNSALHEIVLQRTRGVFDLGRLTAALKGEPCECHPKPEIPEPSFALTHYRPPFIGQAT